MQKSKDGKKASDTRLPRAKDAKCPRMKTSGEKDVNVLTNDVGWYLRDGTPRFSGEFDDLQKIGVVNKVFPSGIALDTAVEYVTVVAPPVDDQNSFYKQCATLLSKVRKKNTGTSIYSTENVLVYVWKMLIATTLAAQLAKEIKAVSHVMPGNADAPWVTLNIVNPHRDWEYEASHLADTKNKADIVFKMIDALPLPRMAAIDRNIMLFSSVFADTKGGKPSFSVFRPDYIADLDMADDRTKINFTARYGSGYNEHIADTLDTIVTILDSIYGDLNANYTMLRGDMLKYWRPQPTCLSLLYSPLVVAPVSSELASQIENASLLGRVASFKPEDFVVTVTADATTLTLPLAGVNDPKLDSKAELDEQPINSRGGVPGDGELMAITALMPVASQINGQSASHWDLLAHNGIVLADAQLLTGTGKNLTSAPTMLGVCENLAQVHSSVQSTMKSAFIALQWMASIMAHSPMLITDQTDPRGFIWDVDFVGVISTQSLRTAVTRVVRSLFQVSLPEVDRH